MPRDTLSGILILVVICILGVFSKYEQPVKPQDSAVFDNKVRVIDGDTIELNSEMIRLFGIDAPEKKQTCTENNIEYRCGENSKKYLQGIVLEGSISCSNEGIDRWGRKISICKIGSEDVNALMVKNGWAIAYRKYSTMYVSQENFARSNKLGMWSKSFLPPSEWRKLKGK